MDQVLESDAWLAWLNTPNKQQCEPGPCIWRLIYFLYDTTTSNQQISNYQHFKSNSDQCECKIRPLKCNIYSTGFNQDIRWVRSFTTANYERSIECLPRHEDRMERHRRWSKEGLKNTDATSHKIALELRRAPWKFKGSFAKTTAPRNLRAAQESLKLWRVGNPGKKVKSRLKVRYVHRLRDELLKSSHRQFHQILAATDNTGLKVTTCLRHDISQMTKNWTGQLLVSSRFFSRQPGIIKPKI